MSHTHGQRCVKYLVLSKSCSHAIIHSCHNQALCLPFLLNQNCSSNTSEHVFAPPHNKREIQIHLWMQPYTSHSEMLYKKILWGLESSQTADHWPLTAQRELTDCPQSNKLVTEWWFFLVFSCCYSWCADTFMRRQSKRPINQLEIKNS